MTLTKTEGVRPLRPEDIKPTTSFPDFVLQAFNDLDAGWKVEYDKPGYNENYKASFKFSRARDERCRV